MVGSPGVVPGMVLHGFSAPAAATVALLEQRAVANGLPPVANEMQA